MSNQMVKILTSFMKLLLLIIFICLSCFWYGQNLLAQNQADAVLTKNPAITISHPVGVLQANDLGISMSVNTNEGKVFNGDVLTYTIMVTKLAGITRNVEVIDILPSNILANIQCSPKQSCFLTNETYTITDPVTSAPVTVSFTRQISWLLSMTSTTLMTQSLAFQGRVQCQADQTVFNNRAFVRDLKSGDFARSNETQATVEIYVDDNGVASISNRATWCSDGLGGTLNSDWADFDNDGDLDLVIASTLGMRVYQNNKGLLTLFWSSNETGIINTRWANVAASVNAYLEIVAVGQTGANNSGQNYIYQYQPTSSLFDTRFQRVHIFTSTRQLFRVEPGDFDNDGDVDLVASTIGKDEPAGNICSIIFYRNLGGGGNFTGPGDCISRSERANNMAAADFNNDGQLDLAIGFLSNKFELLLNQITATQVISTLPFTDAESVSIGSLATFPYDIAWGDYNGDGYLDVAGAFPVLNEALIYRNKQGQGFESPIRISTKPALSPMALDWADFNGDGRVDLIIGDVPPKVYEFPTETTFREIQSLRGVGVPNNSDIRSLRAIDQDNDGDMDLFVGILNSPSLIFTAFSPMLNTRLALVSNQSFPANTVAWGDIDHNGSLDLLYGGYSNSIIGSRIYYNLGGNFPNFDLIGNSFGPHVATFGDINNNGLVDVMLGTSILDEIYLDGQLSATNWASVASFETSSVAWGDATENSKGSLDLLVASQTGQLMLYKNMAAITSEFALTPTHLLEAEEDGSISHVAWADYDLDGLLDFFIGSNTATQRLYRNKGNYSFSKVWEESRFMETQVVAWADIDGDGDLDLTLGNKGHNYVYKNLTCESKGINCQGLLPLRTTVSATLTTDPIWISPTNYDTRGLDWGDWDNDGDLDLAVGNYGQFNEVYSNINGRFVSLWRSNQTYQTTGIAWGDKDADGDLDLAISAADGTNGIYENNYIVPSHLTNNNFAQTMPLPNTPPYVYLDKVGSTYQGRLYASAEILSYQPIPINYKLFDANGTRNPLRLNVAGHSILTTSYTYSLDGGARWKTATITQKQSGPCSCSDTVDLDCKDFSSHTEAQTCFSYCQSQGVGDIHELDPDGDGLACEALTATTRSLFQPRSQTALTSRLGQDNTVYWDAKTDKAITDNGRFRICVASRQDYGRLQRGTVCAVSPSFRVRATTCTWPDNPLITLRDNESNAIIAPAKVISVGQSIKLQGKVTVGTGVLKYNWSITSTQLAGPEIKDFTFSQRGFYTIKLEVTGESCPISKTVIATREINVSDGKFRNYLPTIVRR